MHPKRCNGKTQAIRSPTKRHRTRAHYDTTPTLTLTPENAIVRGSLKFFGAHAGLADKDQFARFLRPLRKSEWVVYAKQPFGGPEAVLAYLSRYTHRIAISNHRLIKADEAGVTFKWKDYRVEGPDRYKTMTLPVDAFIRRFLNHVLPKRFHRIRHYGLVANGNRAANVARARELLSVPSVVLDDDGKSNNTEDKDHGEVARTPCPSCGGRMIIIETFERGCTPKHRPSPPAHAPPRGPP